jgi:hypothetical protein
MAEEMTKEEIAEKLESAKAKLKTLKGDYYKLEKRKTRLTVDLNRVSDERDEVMSAIDDEVSWIERLTKIS